MPKSSIEMYDLGSVNETISRSDNESSFAMKETLLHTMIYYSTVHLGKTSMILFSFFQQKKKICRFSLFNHEKKIKAKIRFCLNFIEK